MNHLEIFALSFFYRLKFQFASEPQNDSKLCMTTCDEICPNCDAITVLKCDQDLVKLDQNLMQDFFDVSQL